MSLLLDLLKVAQKASGYRIPLPFTSFFRYIPIGDPTPTLSAMELIRATFQMQPEGKLDIGSRQLEALKIAGLVDKNGEARKDKPTPSIPQTNSLPAEANSPSGAFNSAGRDPI